MSSPTYRVRRATLDDISLVQWRFRIVFGLLYA